MAATVLVVDDHPMCGTALAMAARSVDPTAVVEQVGSMAEAEHRAKDGRYTLVLLDLLLPDVNGMGGLMMLRHMLPQATLAIVSSREDTGVIQRAAACGARGFIPKSAPISAMIEAIRKLIAGEDAFPAGALDEGGADTGDDAAQRIAQLSAAQLRVLRAIASGRQNKQIAYDLGIAEPTVKSHLAAIFRKLDVTNRTQAVLLYRSLDDGGD